MSYLSDLLMIDGRPFVPFHSGPAAGSKASFLRRDPLVPIAPAEEALSGWHPSRRDLLKTTLIVGGSLSLDQLHPRTARADGGIILFFVGKAALTALIGWLVVRIMDEEFPRRDPRARQVPNPTPTRNPFHNRYAEPVEFTNPDAWIDPQRVAGYNTRFGINKYLLERDMNGLELTQIKKESETSKLPPLPIGLRLPYNPSFRKQLSKAAFDYRSEELPELSEEDVRYVYPFISTSANGRPKSSLGFGVVRGRKAHFLIHD